MNVRRPSRLPPSKMVLKYLEARRRAQLEAARREYLFLIHQARVIVTTHEENHTVFLTRQAVLYTLVVSRRALLVQRLPRLPCVVEVHLPLNNVAALIELVVVKEEGVRVRPPHSYKAFARLQRGELGVEVGL